MVRALTACAKALRLRIEQGGDEKRPYGFKWPAVLRTPSDALLWDMWVSEYGDQWTVSGAGCAFFLMVAYVAVFRRGNQGI